MASPSWNWNGARWWKVDFHTHTPASVGDYGKGPRQAELLQRTPKEWLLDYMRAGIDCVAITDHNSGAWIDKLQEALRKLESGRPDGYQPIHLFPGVEITVHGGVHLLAILASDKTTSDIDWLLGAVGFSGTKGASGDVTSKSFGEVVEVVRGAGGIAIPAHVDGPSGLFELQGTTLGQALHSSGVFAMEVLDSSSPKPALYSEKKLRWTEVLGSDSHHPNGNQGRRFPGSHFTWVKMGSPSLEGLRLALLDGPLSVRRSDEQRGDPNRHAPSVVESIEVTNARYMGREEPFEVKLNPWLNAIVGGRGTGKSSLIEFLRIALRRANELPEDLQSDFEKYASVYPNREDSGLLTSDAAIRVVYRKDGARFRIQWNPSGALDAIQEYTGGDWHPAEGDVAQRFPIQMYSQKQIFHLAKRPLALLQQIDNARDDRLSWSDRWKEEESRFLSLRAKAREIEAGLSEESRLRGELDDVKRKLTVFEETEHSEILRAFQRRRRQQRAAETWEEGWSHTGELLRQIARDLVPDPLDLTSFDTNSEADARLVENAAQARARLDRLGESLEGLATEADQILEKWRASRDESTWKAAVDTAEKGYKALQERLTEEGAGDPAAYGDLVQRRQALKQRLEELKNREKQTENLRAQASDSLQTLLEIRRELTQSRRSFLKSVVQDNPHVRIRVVPYGARETAEADIRKLLQREQGGFEKDIGEPGADGLLGKLYPKDRMHEEFEKALLELKHNLRRIHRGSHDPDTLADQRFATHLQRLPPEALDRLDLWFPEDSLNVQYSPTGDGRDFRSIQEGSPGQKTAALLAFLLSYGAEPLVLDQPEDDLDNHLIYDLIVQQLREVKHRRQVLVVTHNANIVVNGDAELVVALAGRGGETQKECEGSLQKKGVRDTICEVMEGGRDAFEERFRRIHLEERYV